MRITETDWEETKKIKFEEGELLKLLWELENELDDKLIIDLKQNNLVGNYAYVAKDDCSQPVLVVPLTYVETEALINVGIEDNLDKYIVLEEE